MPTYIKLARHNLNKHKISQLIIINWKKRGALLSIHLSLKNFRNFKNLKQMKIDDELVKSTKQMGISHLPAMAQCQSLHLPKF